MSVTTLIQAYERKYNAALALDTMAEVLREAHEYRLARVLPGSEKRTQPGTFLTR